MKAGLGALFPITLLCACGGGEDFAVVARQSPASVVADIGALSFDTERALLSDFQVNSSRPSETELRFTIPAYESPVKQSGESLIALTLEPIEDGKATKIHARVEVPKIRVMLGEKNKVLSEARVEAELRKALDGRVRKADVAQLLAALAVASNVKHQAALNTIRAAPGAVGYAGFFDGGNGEAGTSDDWGASSGTSRAEVQQDHMSFAESDDGFSDDW